MRRKSGDANNYSHEEVNRRFTELANSLGPMDDPTVGPRDYTLAEDDSQFNPADLPKTSPLRPVTVIAIACWLVVVIVPVVFGLAQIVFPTYLKVMLAIVVVVALVTSFLALKPGKPSPGNSEFQDFDGYDDGARV